MTPVPHLESTPCLHLDVYKKESQALDIPHQTLYVLFLKPVPPVSFPSQKNESSILQVTQANNLTDTFGSFHFLTSSIQPVRKSC